MTPSYTHTTMNKNTLALTMLANSGLLSAPAQPEVFLYRKCPGSIYDRERVAPMVRQFPKLGRNNPCPCNSGRKYKHCCINQPTSENETNRITEAT